MNPTLAISYKNATTIGNSCFSFLLKDGEVTYFSNLEPFDSHDAGDNKAMQLRIARFHIKARIAQQGLVAAFGFSRATVQRAVEKYRKGGEEVFYKNRRSRGPSVFDEEKIKQANEMLERGVSGAEVGRRLGIGATTVNLNRRNGVIGVKQSEGEETGREEGGKEEVRGRGERDSREREAAMGRGANDTEGRVLASRGFMDEVEPRFREGAGAVSKGGVLAALPALLREGLLSSVKKLFSLPKGYYGLNSIILFLAFMALARVRNPESLRYESPGEWGAVLGLDRCPEVRTLRGKIRLIADAGETVRLWQRELSRMWLEGEPEDYATLCVDGHVKVYSGRGGKLPKHFVSRQKLCLPASVSYWINALGGKPLLCIHKDIDAGMIRAIEADVLPELELLGVVPANSPDLTAEKESEPAVTLVFDREGWSPKLLKSLAQRGVACVTWHKNFKGDPWDEGDFEKVRVPIYGPVGIGSVEVELAEKSIKLSNKLEVRQIRRLMDTGRQVPVVTTHPSMSVKEVAGAMFSRWSQENYFKYMKERFNLDSLVIHELEDIDPDTMVVNPVGKDMEKLVKKYRGRLGTVRNRVAGEEKKKGNRSVAGKKELEELEEKISELKENISGLGKKVRVGDLGEEEKISVLPEKERLFLDVIRMIAYRAETRMMPAVMECQGKKPNSRKLLQSLLASDADILPDAEKKILRVRFLGFGNDSCERALGKLVDELNETNTIFPGTDMRMVYELPQTWTSNPNRESILIARDQEV